MTLINKRQFSPFGKFAMVKEYFEAIDNHREPKVRMFNRDEHSAELPDLAKDKALRESCKYIIKKRNEIINATVKKRLSEQGSFNSLQNEFFAAIEHIAENALDDEFAIFPCSQLDEFFSQRLAYLGKVPLREETTFDIEVELEFCAKKNIKLINIFGNGELKREIISCIVDKYDNMEIFEITDEHLKSIFGNEEEKIKVLSNIISGFRRKKLHSSKIILFDLRQPVNINYDLDSLLVYMTDENVKITIVLSDERFTITSEIELRYFKIEKLSESKLELSFRELCPFEGMFLSKEIRFLFKEICADSLSEQDILKCAFKSSYVIVHLFLMILKVKGKKVKLTVDHLKMIKGLMKKLGFKLAFGLNKELMSNITLYMKGQLEENVFVERLLGIENSAVKRGLLNLVNTIKNSV